MWLTGQVVGVMFTEGSGPVIWIDSCLPGSSEEIQVGNGGMLVQRSSRSPHGQGMRGP